MMATNISRAFNEFKSRLELSPTLQNAVTTHHGAVRKWIEDYDPTIETGLVGSLQRKTRIQPRSRRDGFDIDILVVFGRFDRWVSSGGITPAAALERLEGIVSKNETYNRMGPETDSPTIIVEYSDDVKVELIPAYRDWIGHAPDGTPTPPVGRGYWIPKSNNWAMADYDYDAAYISKQNEESEKYLIPVIKMLKAAKRHLFPRMRSYHLEILATDIVPAAVRILNNQKSLITYPNLVWLFFAHAKNTVLNTALLPGTNSPDASSYLTFEEKETLSRYFNSIADHARNLLFKDSRDAIEGWRELFGDPFPSYG